MAAPYARTWILLLIVMVPQLGLTLVNPSNATIAEDLGVPISGVEMTLTIYMVGYAASMFFAGTLADRFDAIRLQSLGLVLFAVGSIFCALAPGFTILAIGRFLQAFGGTSATVLCRIIVQRRFPGQVRISILTSMSMVISVTPSLSPLTGGFLGQFLPWRVLFVIMAGFALALIPMIECLLGSARPAVAHLPTPRQFRKAIGGALSNPQFLWCAGGISLVWMTYFGFINSSSTILQNLLGQSPVRYGLLMSIPAVGYLIGSLLVKRSRKLVTAVRGGITVGVLGIFATAIVSLTSLSASPIAVVMVMSLTFVGVGATIPYTQAGLLDLDLPYPGVGAGLFFFLQMACGAAYGAFINTLHLSSVPAFLIVIIIPQVVVAAMFAVEAVIERRRHGGK